MMHRTRALAALVSAGGLAAAGALLAAACSSASPSLQSIYTDAPIATLAPDGAGTTVADEAGTHVLRSFTAPSDPGSGFFITISGESNALAGYLFPPENTSTSTWMVDGWQIAIESFIVVVDHVTLWTNPNQSATDQSQHGPEVARLDGPFVVDLHKGGSITGQGGAPEEATPLGVITRQSDGTALDLAATYAFGFSTVAAPADYAAYDVNLDSSEAADYALMAERGYSVLYRGTATWNGGGSPWGCTETSTGQSADAGDGGYDFSKLPPTMTFRLGFDTPTDYVNCQNGDPMGGSALPGEDNPRGLQVQTGKSVFAQVTVHMDHPFWESFAENTPVHWDQIAAQYVGASGPTEAHTEDLKGVPFYAFTDKTGAPLPWRNCSGSNYAPAGNGQMFFNPLNVHVDPNEPDPSKAIRDYYDFLRYTQSTQGHLNSQGLCFVARRYPAPGGGP